MLQYKGHTARNACFSYAKQMALRYKSFCFLAILTLTFIPSSYCCADKANDSPVVLGYYPGYEKFDQSKIPWHHLTHLCHAFLTSNPEGVLEPNEFVPDPNLTAIAKQHSIPVILSVGGWGDADGFEQATSSDQKMERWIDDLTKIMVENGYAGVDVDWEFPVDESTKKRFTALLLGLRAKFDQLEAETRTHYLITSAVTARPHQGQWIDGPAIESAIDFLNVMTYDFSGPWTQIASHHTPFLASPNDPQASWRSSQQSMIYWEKEQGFPKEKLNLGIPLYGRKFPLRQPYSKLTGLPKEGFGSPEYKEIVQLQTSGWMQIDDADCKVPWLLAPEGEEGLIAYDNPASVRMKSEWAKSDGYRGIFFWAIGHDYLPDGKHHLVEEAVKNWLQTSTE